jgi:hypothetical protein
VPFVINKKDLGEYMKILFAGEWYYPSGGIGDFIMVGTEQECLVKYQEMAMMYLQGIYKYRCDWGQIVDHATMKQEIALSFDRDGFYAKTGTIKIEKMIDGSLETISLTAEDL